MKCCAAASISASSSSRSLRSGPASTRPSGTGTPKRRASISIASGKLTRSRSITNLKTSPPSPQPKQWKAAGSWRTLNEGVFSWWNGHRPFQEVPSFLSATCSEITRTMSAARRTSSTKLSGKAIASPSAPRPSRRRRPRSAPPEPIRGDERVAVEHLRDGLAQLALAEAVHEADLAPLGERRVVEQLVDRSRASSTVSPIRLQLGRDRLAGER